MSASVAPEQAGCGGAGRAPRLGTLATILYGIGGVVDSVRMALFGLFVFFFYTAVLGLSAGLVGLASGIGLLWDAVVDPWIGHWSDGARPGLGRRHAFMLVGGLALGLTFWALFSPPAGLSQAGIFAWLLAASLLVRLAGSLFTVPYHALGAELVQDYHDRTRLTGVRGACGLVGAFAATSLSFVAFFPNPADGSDPKLVVEAYPRLGFGAGLAMTVIALVTVAATLRWRPYLLASSVGAGGAAGQAGRFGLFVAARRALANGSFRALLCSFTAIFLGLAMSATMSLYYFTSFVGIAESRDLSLLQAAFYLGALVGIPLWLGVGRRVEKRHLYVGGAAGIVALMVGSFSLIGPGRLLGVGDVRPLLVSQALSGLLSSILWVVPTSMLADVADDDARANGRGHEGVFFGIFSLGQQLATGLSVVLVGALMEASAGLADAGAALASPVGVERIGLLFGPVPAAMLVVGAVLLRPYRLDSRRVAAIQAALRAEPASAIHPAPAIQPAPAFAAGAAGREAAGDEDEHRSPSGAPSAPGRPRSGRWAATARRAGSRGDAPVPVVGRTLPRELSPKLSPELSPTPSRRSAER